MAGAQPGERRTRSHDAAPASHRTAPLHEVDHAAAPPGPGRCVSPRAAGRRCERGTPRVTARAGASGARQSHLKSLPPTHTMTASARTPSGLDRKLESSGPPTSHPQRDGCAARGKRRGAHDAHARGDRTARSHCGVHSHELDPAWPKLRTRQCSGCWTAIVGRDAAHRRGVHQRTRDRRVCRSTFSRCCERPAPPPSVTQSPRPSATPSPAIRVGDSYGGLRRSRGDPAPITAMTRSCSRTGDSSRLR